MNRFLKIGIFVYFLALGLNRSFAAVKDLEPTFEGVRLGQLIENKDDRNLRIGMYCLDSEVNSDTITFESCRQIQGVYFEYSDSNSAWNAQKLNKRPFDGHLVRKFQNRLRRLLKAESSKKRSPEEYYTMPWLSLTVLFLIAPCAGGACPGFAWQRLPLALALPVTAPLDLIYAVPGTFVKLSKILVQEMKVHKNAMKVAKNIKNTFANGVESSPFVVDANSFQVLFYSILAFDHQGAIRQRK